MEELLQIPLLDVRKLISAGAGDAALLYLYLRSGGMLSQAGSALQLPAATSLGRQLQDVAGVGEYEPQRKEAGFV